MQTMQINYNPTRPGFGEAMQGISSDARRTFAAARGNASSFSGGPVF